MIVVENEIQLYKPPSHKIGTVISDIILITVTLCLFSSILTFLLSGCDFARSNVFGYRLSYVLSGSMEPTIKTHALCLTDMRTKDFKKGDVVVYEHEYTPGDKTDTRMMTALIVHRVIKVYPDGSVETKGDHNKEKDPWITPKNKVVGKVIGYWNGFAKISK